MKILFFGILFSVCGAMGYAYKYKLKLSSELLEYFHEFCAFYDSNMTLFKNNVLDVVERFKTLNAKKFGKFNQFFLKENQILNFDKKLLQKYLSDESVLVLINNYFSGLGKSDYEYEKEKNKNFDNYIKTALAGAQKAYEQKGGLVFKLSLALGAVMCIVLW